MSCANQNITPCFIDLATFDTLDSYMYNGPDAYTMFVRQHKKCSWFAQTPVPLSAASGRVGFDTEWSVNISRAGDYLLHSWISVVTPVIKLSSKFQESLTQENNNQHLRMRWTRNLGHNLFKCFRITFNDMTAQQFDSYFLDFHAAFTVPASKRVGYDNMIGNYSDLTWPHSRKPVLVTGDNLPSTYAEVNTIPSRRLNVPLPFFFTRDSGVALPTAALPYNTMEIHVQTRHWSELLIVDDISKVGTGVNPSRPAMEDDFEGCCTPQLTDARVWANYAVVSNDERKRMACGARDVLIEQVQSTPRQCVLVNSCDTCPRFDVRFSHAIKTLFTVVCNRTTKSEWSNYTGGCPVPDSAVVDWNSDSMSSAIDAITLTYENTQRLAEMDVSYYSLIQPWYHAPAIPLETGYHMYNFSLDMASLDPQGSTNFGKLTNTSFQLKFSRDACISAVGGWPKARNPDGTLVPGVTPSGGDFPNLFEAHAIGINWNVLRIAGGTAGFPVM